MFEVYALLFLCTILAVIVDKGSYRISDGYLVNEPSGVIGLLLYSVLVIALICFSGTRTRMNDTVTYMQSYVLKTPSTLDGIADIDWRLGNNPLFHVYQVLLKTYISKDPQVFLFITAAITISLMMMFLYRYSWSFSQSFYLFISFTVYGFTMAAMKQTLATAIAVWIVPCFAQKKYFCVLLLISVAVLIHPYSAIILIALLFFNKGIWNNTVKTMFICTIIIGLSFSRFVRLTFMLTKVLGMDYEENWDLAKSGVGVARVVAYSIVPILSLAFRKEIEKNSNPFYDLCINMSIIAMCLSIISRFGGAVLFGRLPSYFALFICIALPYVLFCAENKSNNKESLYIRDTSQRNKSLTIGVLALYLCYYATYYHKFFVSYGVSMWGSVYNRVPLIELFGG